LLQSPAAAGALRTIPSTKRLRGWNNKATRDEILRSLPIRAIVEAAGGRFVGSGPNADGYMTMHAMGKEDRHPSASLNIAGQPPKLGRYKAFNEDGLSIDWWEFCSRHLDMGSSFNDIVRRCAQLAGIYIPDKKQRGSARKKKRRKSSAHANNKSTVFKTCEPTKDQDTALAHVDRFDQSDWPKPLLPQYTKEFVDELIATRCRDFPGITPEGIRRAGCEVRTSRHGKVICLQCYGELSDDRPIGLKYRAAFAKGMLSCNGVPTKELSTKRKPGCRGQVMGRLPDISAASTVVVPEGLSDLIAFYSLNPPADWVAISPTDGAAQLCPEWLPPRLCNKHVLIVPDCDSAGEIMASNWGAAIAPFAASVRIVRLPLGPSPNSENNDLRHYIAQGAQFDDFRALADSADLVEASSIQAKAEPQSLATDSEANGESVVQVDSEDEEPCDASIDRQTIIFDTHTKTIDQICGEAGAALDFTGRFFNRTGSLIEIRDDAASPVSDSATLIGRLAEITEFFQPIGTGSEDDNEDEETESGNGFYLTFPSPIASAFLHNPAQLRRFRSISTFTRSPCFTVDWRLINKPGYDLESGVYYSGPAIEPNESGERPHLNNLLDGFCFEETAASRTNYIAVLLTSLLSLRFIGARPIALFSANQPELGKTMLAQIIAILRNGKKSPTISYNENDEEFEKRICAEVRGGADVIIIDNAKPRRGRRSPFIASACLDRSTTDAIVSFRVLGTSSTIAVENTIQFCLTANSPQVDPDLVSRSVPINLFFEGDKSKRHFEIASPEQYALDHREEIVAELLGMVTRWIAAGKKEGDRVSRFDKAGWGRIIGGILSEAGEEGFMANAAEASERFDPARQEFADLLALMAGTGALVWTAGQIAAYASAQSIFLDELGDGSARSQATRLGLILGRYLNCVSKDKGLSESHAVDIPGGRTALLTREDGKDGKLYRIKIK
jgi:hypothetical protein